MVLLCIYWKLKSKHRLCGKLLCQHSQINKTKININYHVKINKCDILVVFTR